MTANKCEPFTTTDYGTRRCHTCGRTIMLVRRTHRAKAHWQHVGDGLTQYRSWGIKSSKCR